MNRTRETADYFDDNLYAVKAMRMLDEIVLSTVICVFTIESWRMRRLNCRGDTGTISRRV